MEKFKEEALKNEMVPSSKSSSDLANRPEVLTYRKSQQSVDERSIEVEGILMKEKEILSVREKDGMTIPHHVKMLICEPAATIKMVLDNSLIKETLNGVDSKILTQFLSDSKRFEAKYKPEKILKYENTIQIDEVEGKSTFELSICFLSDRQEKMLYTYSILQGAKEGQTRVHRIQNID